MSVSADKPAAPPSESQMFLRQMQVELSATHGKVAEEKRGGSQPSVQAPATAALHHEQADKTMPNPRGVNITI